jgi:hypothetical protein
MKRILPLVDIVGTAFFVDVLRDELRQQDDPKNTIPFAVFEQDGDGYTFLYDTLQKNTPDSDTAMEKMEDHCQWVTLPALMELDPEGIALKYNIPIEILCPERALADPLGEDEQDYDEEQYY